ncbi:MAG TPA: divergent polysaccharide deacetylase family protein [Thermoanaerobaculia bacterium]|nr:divergent polysaccharide deacetylase family protein [Thermoanaerobaculia bacterium]
MTGRRGRAGSRVRRARGRPRRRTPAGVGLLTAGLAIALVVLGLLAVVASRRGPSTPAVGAETATAAGAGGPSDLGAAGDETRVPAGDLALANPHAVDLPGAPAPPANRPVFVALVIDDLGRRVEDVDELRALGVELSYAVLPFEARTAEVVARLHEAGAEILVHLPMEPDGLADPGPGALLRGMDEAELARRTAEALDAVQGAVGVNNHMGSALSADDRAMSVILERVHERELFYLDSRTSAGSVGFDQARRAGMPAARRDVFLDGVLDPAAIREQFRRLLQVALEEGAAIAIGHPHPETLEVLREEVPKAAALGYRFVPVSYVLERTGGD